MKPALIFFLILLIGASQPYDGLYAAKKKKKPQEDADLAKLGTGFDAMTKQLEEMRARAMQVPDTVSMTQIVYWPGDSIAVNISGTIHNTGECGMGDPIYSVEKREGDAWKEIRSSPGRMFCGYPYLHFDKSRLFLFKNAGESFLEWGEYRLVFYNRHNQRMATPSFTVMEQW